MKPPDEPTDDRLLSDLAREIAPPAELEARLNGELRRRGLVGRDRPSRWRWRLAASALLAFALGLWLGPGFEAPPAGGGADETPRYLLLLYEPRPIERAELDLVAEYGEWAGELARSGRLVAAEKLMAEDRRFGAAELAPGGAGITPTGFFLIRAASREEAERIAQDCPHLKHGGEVSLRPVDPT